MPSKQNFITEIKLYLTNLQPISFTQKMFFIKYLTVMVKGGLSITLAMQTLAKQTSNKRFQNVIFALYDDVQNGKSLAQAFSRHPKIFSELFVNMIKSGEMSGKLEEVLEQLYIQMYKEHDLVSKIKGALIYPIIVITAMIAIGILTIVFIIPKLTEVFKEFDAELPLMTRMLIKVSELLTSHGIIVAIAIVGITLALLKIKKTTRGKWYFDFIILKLPIIGSIVKKINLAKFSRTFSSLLKTDVPILDAIITTSSVLNSSLYKKQILRSTEYVKKGLPIAQSLEENPSLFPPVVTQMLSVGEKTGSVEHILEELANFYEESVSQTMKNLPSIIEPILLLILGIGVGVMAVAVIMPMYTLAQQF